VECTENCRGLEGCGGTGGARGAAHWTQPVIGLRAGRLLLGRL
jgi:hypothetical protein